MAWTFDAALDEEFVDVLDRNDEWGTIKRKGRHLISPGRAVTALWSVFLAVRSYGIGRLRARSSDG